MSSFKKSTQRFASVNKSRESHKTHFLALLSFFATAPVGEAYFQAYCKARNPEWKELFYTASQWDSDRFGHVLRELQAGSYGKISGNRGYYHFIADPDLQSQVLEDETTDTKQSLVLEAIMVLSTYLETHSEDMVRIEDKEQFMNHLDSCIADENHLFDHAKSQIFVKSQAARVIARFYQEMRRLEDAEIFLKIALSCESPVQGVNAPEVLNLLQSLAVLHGLQCDHQRSEDLLRMILSRRLESYGPEHLEVLRTREDLANCYFNQRRFAEAEKEYLSILEKVKKPWITLRNNYAIYCAWNGQYDIAEKLFEANLHERQGMQQPFNAEVLQAKHNLATVYHQQGKNLEAEGIFQEALGGKLRIFGWSHSETLSTARQLHEVWTDLERFEHADSLLMRITEGERLLRGSEDPEVQQATNELLSWLFEGSEHPNTREEIKESVPSLRSSEKTFELAGYV